jgi:hypothetical protein
MGYPVEPLGSIINVKPHQNANDPSSLPIHTTASPLVRTQLARQD